MSKSTLYIMCGLPFSGKTTLARTLANHCGFVHLDLDAIARGKNLFPEEGISDEQWSQVFREVHRQVADLLSSGKSVVFDAVNYDLAGRDRLRMIAQQSNSLVYVIYINLPMQEIEKRRQTNQANHERPHVRDVDLVELATDFEIPTTEENLLVYEGTQSILEWIKNYVRCNVPAT
jgi:predicted kinase